MPAKAGTKPKPQRAGGYHVRTGCITCKIRHVKCDEEKPACLKCRNTGRTCDGYLQNSRRRSAISTTSETTANGSPGTTTPTPKTNEASKALAVAHAFQFLLPPTTSTLSPSITGTAQERQCFEYFRLQIGQELSTALLLEPTHHFVLQACHTDPAIKSAVIAMGAMGQRLRINHLLTSDNEEANVFQEYAQLQYCKALKHLRAKMTNEPEGSLHLAIISCFLFTIFEFLQGNDEGSLVHLKSGLNILRREIEATAGDQEDSLRKEITRIFSIMDIQATAWLALPTFQAPAIMPLEILRETNRSIIGPTEVPSSSPFHLHHFLSLEAAAASLNFQITRMYHFRRSVTAYTTSPEVIPPNVYARRQDMVEELAQWLPAVESLIKGIPEPTEEMLHRVTVMRLNYRLNSFLLTTCLQPSSASHLSYRAHSQFREILDLAKTLLKSGLPRERIHRIVALNNQDINPVPLFSFYAGVVQPVFYVAVNCRDLDMAKEAIGMLKDDPWREGAWDSASMARIAQRKVKQSEETGCYDETDVNQLSCTDVGVPFETLLEGVEDLQMPSNTSYDSKPHEQLVSWPHTTGAKAMFNTNQLNRKTSWLDMGWDSGPSTLAHTSVNGSPSANISTNGSSDPVFEPGCTLHPNCMMNGPSEELKQWVNGHNDVEQASANASAGAAYGLQ